MGRGLARDSNFSVEKFGLGTASRPRQQTRHRSGVRVSPRKQLKLLALPTNCADLFVVYY